MIQRIQTIWLLLASLCAFLTIKFSFYTGILVDDLQRKLIALNAASTIPLIVLTVAVAIAALVTIFLFKDRRMQLRITIANLLVSVLLIVLYFSAVNNRYNEGSYDLTAPLIFLVPFFLLFAARGIYKDDRLVKSVDRLR